jgi:hypothetical protein
MDNIMENHEYAPTQELAVLYATRRLTAQEDQNILRELAAGNGGYEFEIIRNLEGGSMEGKSHYFRFLKRHFSRRGQSRQDSDFDSVSSEGSTRVVLASTQSAHESREFSLFKGDQNPSRKRRWINLIRNRCLD